MFNYGFELFVNLFQGVMFTVFCYKFLTPSRNKICEGIAFCVASLLMFLSITQINMLYVTFAYIETVVFFAIMIPYCVLFFKDRIFVKILTPVILNVIYSVLSFGINYIFSAIISCDYNYLMTESSQYRYMYVLMSNLIFVIVLFIIYNLFKSSLSHIHKQEILITLVIPLLSIAVGLLTFLVSSNADMSDFDRIVLGAVSIIILSFTFINFYLIKSLSKNYSLENENILLNKEKELYNVQMTSSEKYMKIEFKITAFNVIYVIFKIAIYVLCYFIYVKYLFEKKLPKIEEIVYNGKPFPAGMIAVALTIAIKPVISLLGQNGVISSVIFNDLIALTEYIGAVCLIINIIDALVKAYYAKIYSIN